MNIETLSDCEDTNTPIRPANNPVETGNPGLPELETELEQESFGFDHDAPDPNEQHTEITFTDDDRRDFAYLEQRAESGGRQEAESLRELRDRHLWRLIQDEQGSQRYPNFDAYCRDRWGHSRQWVTHRTNWLRITEELERQGFPVPHLTVKAAQGLCCGRLPEAGGIVPVLREAKEDGVPLDGDHLREIVLRRADYLYWSMNGKEGVNKPAAKTYTDYKIDLAAVKDMRHGNLDLADIKGCEGDLADNIVSHCRQKDILPNPFDLLALLTGTALIEVVGRLNDLARKPADMAVTDQQEPSNGAEPAVTTTQGAKKQRKPKGEAKNNGKPNQPVPTSASASVPLAAGQNGATPVQAAPTNGTCAGQTATPQRHAPPVQVAPKTDAPPVQPPAQNDATPVHAAPQRDYTPVQPATPQDDLDADQGMEQGEVYMGLHTAWQILDETLSSELWPDKDSELCAILRKARQCQETLAEVIAKVKLLIAATVNEQSEAIA